MLIKDVIIIKNNKILIILLSHVLLLYLKFQKYRRFN